MNAQPRHTAANLAEVVPFLDEALDSLDGEDRAAVRSGSSSGVIFGL